MPPWRCLHQVAGPHHNPWSLQAPLLPLPTGAPQTHPLLPAVFSTLGGGWDDDDGMGTMMMGGVVMTMYTVETMYV